MCTRQDTDFAIKLTDILETSAVGPDTFVKDIVAYHFILQRFKLKENIVSADLIALGIKLSIGAQVLGQFFRYSGNSVLAL